MFSVNNIVKIINYKQASMYIKHGVKPIDLYYTDVLVFVFDRDETREVYDKWCKYELN